MIDNQQIITAIFSFVIILLIRSYMIVCFQKYTTEDGKKKLSTTGSLSTCITPKGVFHTNPLLFPLDIIRGLFS